MLYVLFAWLWVSVVCPGAAEGVKASYQIHLQVPRTSCPKSTAKSLDLNKEIKKNANVKWKNHNQESKTASQRHNGE